MFGRVRWGYLVPFLAIWPPSCGGSDAPTCGKGDASSPHLSKVGETCSETWDCDSGLVCVGAVCQQEGAVCPDERECSRLECGPDPVCGTSCGNCSAGEACSDGACVECTPSCDSKECGDDGCGGTCGECNGDMMCENDQCIASSSCEPDWSTPEGLKWVTIPGGTFLMGCSINDTGCAWDEKSVHPITIATFQMLETEVTEAQYAALMNKNPSCDHNGGGGDDNPVECIDWYNAKSFCEIIGGRLPTEAEWEYAARGGTTRRFYCGEDAPCLRDIAWFDSNSSDIKHPVKQLEANAYGLYDMLGNVSEWTNDWYDELYYDRITPINPRGPESGTDRVVRGGSYLDGFATLTVSKRNCYDPSDDLIDLGFRCARSH